MATPSTSRGVEGVTSEPNRVVNDVVSHASEIVHTEEPNEEEIGKYIDNSYCFFLSFNWFIFKDEAFQNVFSGFSQAAEKEILVMLDAETLKSKTTNEK